MHQRRYFGTDGIRDVANRGRLAPDMVLRIGHAIGRVVSESHEGGERPRILMVRDTRISGPMISRLLSGAVLAHGVDVLDAGVLPTPAAAHLVHRLGLDLGIVVSASHNPMPDNGIKIFGPDGRKLSDDTELEVERCIDLAGSRDVEVTGEDVGRLTPFREGEDLYIELMCEELFKSLDLTGMAVVVDCSNGSGSRSAPRILAALGADVTSVNDEPDGCNINRDCGVFHIGDHAGLVKRSGADIALALDGDGDRVLLLDENGAFRDGDAMMAILARHLDAAAPKKLVATVMSNLGLKVLLKKAGIELEMTPVGDRYVAERMESSGAVVGGEQSGHVIFRLGDAWIGDGLYTALRVMEVMRREQAPLSRLAAEMETFPQILVNVAVTEKPPISEIPDLQDRIRAHQLTLGDEGRILVRYSGTEKLARVMVEGRDERQIGEMASDLAAILKAEIG